LLNLFLMCFTSFINVSISVRSPPTSSSGRRVERDLLLTTGSLLLATAALTGGLNCEAPLSLGATCFAGRVGSEIVFLSNSLHQDLTSRNRSSLSLIVDLKFKREKLGGEPNAGLRAARAGDLDIDGRIVLQQMDSEVILTILEFLL
jgi:hypothetical protein